MSRQLRTLIIGAVLCLVLAATTFVVSVPYVVLSPGDIDDTLGQVNGVPIISVTGKQARATSGQLFLTTVSVTTSRTTAAQAIAGWLAHDKVVVPHDSIFPPGQTQKQVGEQETQEFTSSQDSAAAAAACELGYPQGFGVVSVTSTSANAGTLKPGDQFVRVGTHPVSDDTTLKAALVGLKTGDSIAAVVTRDKGPVDVTLKLGAPASGSTTPLLGIQVAQTCLTPYTVNLNLPGIGGPSAGLMFALGILDKVGDTDLTYGRSIAGTGTIDVKGSVGAIGGIALKMIGARRKGATIFLAPESNCGDVRGNIPSGLDVVAVQSLHDAVTDLALLHEGKSVPHC